MNEDTQEMHTLDEQNAATNTAREAWSAAAEQGREREARAEERRLLVNECGALLGEREAPAEVFREINYEQTTGRVRAEIAQAFGLRGDEVPDNPLILQRLLSANKPGGGIHNVRLMGIIGKVPEGVEITLENALRAIIVADSDNSNQTLVLDPNHKDDDQRQSIMSVSLKSYSEFRGPNASPAYVMRPGPENDRPQVTAAELQAYRGTIKALTTQGK